LKNGKEDLNMRTPALRFLTKLALAGLLILPLAISAEANERHGGSRGRVVIVPGYSYYYPYYGYPAWGWGGYWGNPYWNYAPYYEETKGKIKIKDFDKSDQVYIDGAYAGTAGKMKTIKLDPGRYTIQVRRQGTEILNRNVYVVAGKTVEIDFNGG
jgi:hypothetical protein